MTIQQLFEKALHDPAFFNELAKDPVKAFKSAGLTATPDQLASLKHLNYKALDAVAAAFGAGVSTNVT